VGRNSVRGPNYFDVDTTFGRAFGRPATHFRGEGAQINIGADFSNIFNELTLPVFGHTRFVINLSIVGRFQGSACPKRGQDSHLSPFPAKNQVIVAAQIREFVAQ